MGDFNSHSTLWGYNDTNNDGRGVSDWADLEGVFLVHDGKEKGTFHSARWDRDYNPDLCFVSKNRHNLPLHCKRRVLSNFPKSQHRPVLVSVGTQIPIVRSIPKPRWNFGKARWKNFTSELDHNIQWIAPKVQNYHRFVGLLHTVAKNNIPRGYRKTYIPGWSRECTTLYEEYENGHDPDVADELIQCLDSSRREKWRELTESLNFQHSSKKAWSLLKKLDDCQPSQRRPLTSIKPNTIANRIVDLTRGSVGVNKEKTKAIKHELRTRLSQAKQMSEFSRDFTISEISEALKETKTGKAAGLDGVFPEFLRHCGPRTLSWLTSFYNEVLRSGQLPTMFKQTKIVAILKPGKEGLNPEDYRPIALLSVCYKLLERLIHNRIKPVVEELLPIEQAGFRSGRSCCDQVLALTTHIEYGFEHHKKSIATFIDLSSAYDTVWRHGMILKFLRFVDSAMLANLLNTMLSNRFVEVHLNGQRTRKYRLNDGLPQGSVLAPLLFNIYISDLPVTTSRKFIYADDIALVSQNPDFQTSEDKLSRDLERMDEFFTIWRLRPNIRKTEAACFHLCNRQAQYAPRVMFRGQFLPGNPTPKYLGVTIDRSLTFREHLHKTAGKLKTRNNILHKISGISWGADAAVLRTSALALVYSVAEYCCPVWLNSAHTNVVDTQLHETMRIVSGTIKSTPLQWLPVLANIPPPVIRRKTALSKEWQKCCSNKLLPVHRDCSSGVARLKSRKPPWKLGQQLIDDGFNSNDAWRKEWATSNPDSLHLITDPSERPPGFDLSRRDWTVLNRIRTNHGRTRYWRHKWGLADDPGCSCGDPFQTPHHIATDCPNRRFPGSVQELHEAGVGAIEWIRDLDIHI